MDEEIRFDAQAAFLGRPSDEVVRQLARNMTLTVDLNAPTTLPPELSKKVADSKRLRRLKARDSSLTQQLKEKYKFVHLAPSTDSLLKKKIKIKATMQHVKVYRRNRIFEKARKDYFQNTDLAIFEAQFGDLPNTSRDHGFNSMPSSRYDLAERGELVRLTCHPANQISYQEKHARRLATLHARVALCGRQETRRYQASSLHPSDGLLTPKKLEDVSEDELASTEKRDPFPMICKSRQCLFCLGNNSKSIIGRLFEFARASKMMDHVENCHLKLIQASDPVVCPHPKCRETGEVLQSVKIFKNHAAKVHGIALRS